MAGNADLGVYRFFVESLFHEQAHVLDERGERLLSFAGRVVDIAVHVSIPKIPSLKSLIPHAAGTAGGKDHNVKIRHDSVA